MSFKPGCFGSPLCYTDVSLPCTLCPYKEACGEEADACSKRLRTKYGIDEAVAEANRAIRRKPASKPAGKQIKMVAKTASAASKLAQPMKPALAPVIANGLPVKAQELKQRIESKGINLKRALARGVNPFAAQPPAYMRVLTNLVLAKPFTREEAVQTLERDLGWGNSTAASHVSFATAYLQSEGVIGLKDGIYQKEIM